MNVGVHLRLIRYRVHYSLCQLIKEFPQLCENGSLCPARWGWGRGRREVRRDAGASRKDTKSPGRAGPGQGAELGAPRSGAKKRPARPGQARLTLVGLTYCRRSGSTPIACGCKVRVPYHASQGIQVTCRGSTFTLCTGSLERTISLRSAKCGHAPGKSCVSKFRYE